MYDPESFFVDNPINRYAISSWMPLRREGDGSLYIYIQHGSPGADREETSAATTLRSRDMASASSEGPS